MKTIFFLILSMALACSLHAQDVVADTVSAEYDAGSDTTVSVMDTSFYTAVKPDTALRGSMEGNLEAYSREKIAPAPFDQKKWKEIVNGADYSEKDEVPKEIKPPPRSPLRFDGPTVKLLSYILIAGFIIFVLYYILRNVNLNKITIDKTVNLSGYDEPVQNIDDLAIDDLLKEAVSNGNYKAAIRLHYLDILRRLNTSGKIVWMKDKTNREYLNELFVISWYFTEVRRLTLAYEQVWYGEHALTADAYRLLRENFEATKKQISTP